jgi:ankyrin repeat protein
MNSSRRSLELAIAHGDTAETKMLLDGYPELLDIRFEENIGLTPLMWACRNRHITIVELLLERGASVRETNFREVSGDGGNSPLWFTAQGPLPGTVPIGRLLTQAGAEIDQTGEHGTTAFFMAVLGSTWSLFNFYYPVERHRSSKTIEG